MTKSKRATKLVRLAWLADSGRPRVGSDNPDVATILATIDDDVRAVPIDPIAQYPYLARLTVACDLFASAAMSWAVAMGGEP